MSPPPIESKFPAACPAFPRVYAPDTSIIPDLIAGDGRFDAFIADLGLRHLVALQAVLRQQISDTELHYAEACRRSCELNSVPLVAGLGDDAVGALESVEYALIDLALLRAREERLTRLLDQRRVAMAEEFLTALEETPFLRARLLRAVAPELAAAVAAGVNAKGGDRR